jgi:hypothetical protein
MFVFRLTIPGLVLKQEFLMFRSNYTLPPFPPPPKNQKKKSGSAIRV